MYLDKERLKLLFVRSFSSGAHLAGVQPGSVPALLSHFWHRSPDGPMPAALRQGWCAGQGHICMYVLQSRVLLLSLCLPAYDPLLRLIAQVLGIILRAKTSYCVGWAFVKTTLKILVINIFPGVLLAEHC